MDAKPLREEPRFAPPPNTANMVAACRSLAAAALHATSAIQIVNSAVAVVREVLRIDRVRVFLLDNASGKLKLHGCCESGLAPLADPQAIQPGNSIVEMVAQIGKAAIFENCATDPFYHRFTVGRAAGREPYLFFAAFPLRGRSSTAGVLTCSDPTPRELSSIENDFIDSITAQLAGALEHLQLRDQLEIAEQSLRHQTAELERQDLASMPAATTLAGAAQSHLNSIADLALMMRRQVLGEITLQQARALETLAAESENLRSALHPLFSRRIGEPPQH